jgi:hypothetical protein
VHAGGTTRIPIQPKRIVALHSTVLMWPLATLGVKPIAMHAAPSNDPPAVALLHCDGAWQRGLPTGPLVVSR